MVNKKNFISLISVLTLSASGFSADKPDLSKEKLDLQKREPINLRGRAIAAGMQPIPSSKQDLYNLIDTDDQDLLTDKKIELGKNLFFDPRLSKSGIISCNTCHNLAEGGADGLPTAIGHKWTSNPHHLNSPTVYNAVFSDGQFWDSRVRNLTEQAGGPIEAGPEMALPRHDAETIIGSMDGYKKLFKEAFGDAKVTFLKISSAIAAFEKTLITPAPFDNWLEGDEDAISPKAKEGMEKFISLGCVSCHKGVVMGGGIHNFPTVKPFKYAKVGDFKGAGGVGVKAPTLRNLSDTAPYFHNGTVWELKEAVQIMGETQLGIDINQKDNEDIVEFLKTLDGKKPVITLPRLPSRDAKTPKPKN